MATAEQQRLIEQDIAEGRINPMNDVLFKFVFGREERKDLLIDFLNVVLGRKDNDRIKDLQYCNSETLPPFYDDKLTRLDILCTIEDGTQVDIEVQIVDRQNMDRRVEYYACQLFLDGLKKGGKYQDLKPVIIISLLSYVMCAEEPLHSMYGFYNPETLHRLNNDIELHFLEIPKLQKKSIIQMSRIERWLAYFSRKLSQAELKELAMSETNIQNAIDATRTFFMDKKERLAYINHEMAVLDYESDKAAYIEQGLQRGRQEGIQQGRQEGIQQGRQEGIQQGRQEGIQQGRQEGIQQGQQERSLEIARNLKLKGIDLNTIAECSGLSLDEIKIL